MTMTNLIRRYEELTMAERVNAIREAEQAGADAAAADAGLGGEPCEANAKTYYMCLIDQADSDAMTATLDDLDGDPRVAAFARGWSAEWSERADRD